MTDSFGAFGPSWIPASEVTAMQHKEYKSINKSVRKKDSMQLLLGKPVYTDDVTPDGALIVKLLRSPHANAIVERLGKSFSHFHSQCNTHRIALTLQQSDWL